ncbi:hypothetical protein [Paraburkholderia sp. RL17-337-BIB-A]|uniref:hypothetical protein n=1 Tax=Paraburkholderia sp. RL17-337-BIB-A TaxID=3031636 RepID=UPI0038BDB573
MIRVIEENPRPWVRRLLQIVGLSAVIAVSVTWAGSVYDQPIDSAILAGIAAPECAGVRAMPAGSLFLAKQPDDAICRSFFMYRASFADAADDVTGYVASVNLGRLAEFWQLVGYVWGLSFAAVVVSYWLFVVLRAGLRRNWRSKRQHEHTPRRGCPHSD